MCGLKLNPDALKHHGLELGAYDGAKKRRFVLFADQGNGTVLRMEHDTKRERDEQAFRELMRRARGGNWDILA